MKRAWLIFELLVAFTCVCIVAMLLSYIWPHAEKPKDVWDILTAIGTVGAALAAVCIALRDAAWRREARQSEALITWGLLAPEIEQLSETLREARAHINDPNTLRYLALPNPQTKNFSTRLQVSIGKELLDKLAYLPSQRGESIAAAMGLLPGIAVRIRDFAFESRVPERTAVRDSVAFSIDAAIRHFEDALSYYKSPAQLRRHAPTPASTKA